MTYQHEYVKPDGNPCHNKKIIAKLRYESDKLLQVTEWGFNVDKGWTGWFSVASLFRNMNLRDATAQKDAIQDVLNDNYFEVWYKEGSVFAIRGREQGVRTTRKANNPCGLLKLNPSYVPDDSKPNKRSKTPPSYPLDKRLNSDECYNNPKRCRSGSILAATDGCGSKSTEADPAGDTGYDDCGTGVATNFFIDNRVAIANSDHAVRMAEALHNVNRRIFLIDCLDKPHPASKKLGRTQENVFYFHVPIGYSCPRGGQYIPNHDRETEIILALDVCRQAMENDDLVLISCKATKHRSVVFSVVLMAIHENNDRTCEKEKLLDVYHKFLKSHGIASLKGNRFEMAEDLYNKIVSRDRKKMEAEFSNDGEGLVYESDVELKEV